ncbi:MAG: TIGR04211 family SH3 domain-containing protein [Desulfopila sp.]
MIAHYHSSTMSKPTLLPFLLFFVLLSSFVLTVTDPLRAESLYVKPRSEAVVRTGQGTQYKIVATVKEGTKVEVLQKESGYALIRLDNGVQGWIIQRYLHVDPPPDQLVESLRKEKEELLAKDQEYAKEMEQVSTVLMKTKTDLDLMVAQRDNIAADYQQLQLDTADVIGMKKEMEEIAEENRVLVKSITGLKEENEDMKKDRTVNWFLAGGGVLLLGILLGRMQFSSRRRKSSLTL